MRERKAKFPSHVTKTCNRGLHGSCPGSATTWGRAPLPEVSNVLTTEVHEVMVVGRRRLYTNRNTRASLSLSTDDTHIRD